MTRSLPRPHNWPQEHGNPNLGEIGSGFRVSICLLSSLSASPAWRDRPPNRAYRPRASLGYCGPWSAVHWLPTVTDHGPFVIALNDHGFGGLSRPSRPALDQAETGHARDGRPVGLPSVGGRLSVALRAARNVSGHALDTRPIGS